MQYIKHEFSSYINHVHAFITQTPDKPEFIWIMVLVFCILLCEVLCNTVNHQFFVTLKFNSTYKKPICIYINISVCMNSMKVCLVNIL